MRVNTIKATCNVTSGLVAMLLFLSGCESEGTRVDSWEEIPAENPSDKRSDKEVLEAFKSDSVNELSNVQRAMAVAGEFKAPTITIFRIAPYGGPHDTLVYDSAGVPVHDDEHMYGRPILETEDVALPVAKQRIVEVLQSPKLYADDTGIPLCFDPGMAIRLVEGERRLDVVVCLECHGIEFHAKEADLDEYFVLSGLGEFQLEKIYELTFSSGNN